MNITIVSLNKTYYQIIKANIGKIIVNMSIHLSNIYIYVYTWKTTSAEPVMCKP